MAKQGSLWAALGMLAGLAGCQSQTGSLADSDTSHTVTTLPEGAVVKKEAVPAKHPPRADTCVAYGDFRVNEAAASDQPGTRDQMREQARKAYLQALSIDPKNLKAHQGMARLQTSTGDYEQAIATLKKALQFYPKEAALWYDLGMAQSRKKEWEPALASLSKAAKLEPQNRTNVNMYGYALARVGRYDESLACFTRLNGEAKAHYNLARMLEHLERRDESKKHLELALKLDPTLEPARQLLAKLARPVGQELKPASKGQGPVPQEIQEVGFQHPSKPTNPTNPTTGSPSALPEFDGAQNLAPPQAGPEIEAGVDGSVMLPRPPMIFARPIPTVPTVPSRTTEKVAE